jgi:hypothetical protein
LRKVRGAKFVGARATPGCPNSTPAASPPNPQREQKGILDPQNIQQAARMDEKTFIVE